MLVSDTRGRCRIFVSVNSRVRGGEREEEHARACASVGVRILCYRSR